MDIVVQLPDGSEAHFPDGTPNAVMLAAVQKQHAATQDTPAGDGSVSWKDRALGAANAVNEGAARLVDTVNNRFGDVWDLGKAAAGMGAVGLNAVSGGKLGYSGAQLGEPGNPFNTTEGVFNGPAYRDVAEKAAIKAGAIQPSYDKTDLQGRAINLAGNMVGGGAVSPSSIAGAGANGLSAALANMGKQALPIIGATGGQLAAEKVAPDSPYLQAAAGMLGGIGGGLTTMLRPSAGAVAARTLAGTSPEQQALAAALTKGGNVTGPEALAYASGSTNPVKYQRYIENSVGGGEAMAPYMADRVAKNDSLVSALMDKVSPDMGMRNPYTTGDNVVDAAQQAIKTQTDARTAAVSPFYQAAAKQTLADDLVANLVKQLGGAAVDAGTQTDIGKALSTLYKKVSPGGVPDNRVGVLDNIYKETRDQMALAPNEQNAVTKSISSAVNGQNRALGDALMQNPNIAKGRALYQQMTANNVAPLQNSPVGQLAKIGENVNPQSTMTQAQGILAPPEPNGVINPDQIAYTASKLSAESPNALSDFARQHIQSAWDESNKFINGEPAQFNGKRFAQTVAGNPAQSDNLVALVQGAAGTDAAAGMTKVLETFRAQGQRLPANSATQLNREISEQAEGGALGKLATPLESVKEFAIKMAGAKNTKELADIMTSPDSVERLRAIAQTAGSRAGQATLNSLPAGLAAARAQYAPLVASPSNGP